MLRALIFDLDHTLLNSQKQIGEENRDAVLRAKDAGFKIVISTSRPIRAIRRFVDPKILLESIVISLNGSVVHLPNSPSTALTFGFIGDSVEPLLATLCAFEKELSFSAEIDGYHFATNYDFDESELWSEHSATHEMVIPLHQLDHRAVTKLAVDGRGKKLPGVIELAGSFPELRFISADDGTFVNIVPIGVDKSLTLGAVARSEQLDLRKSFVFGDDIPDIKMFEVVGTRVAMGNARDEVKDRATHVIGHCDTNSIAEFIDLSVL